MNFVKPTMHDHAVSASKERYHAFLVTCFGVFGFVLSCFLSPFYFDGDQKFYRNLYLGLWDSVDIAAAFDFYKSTVGASEPAYLLLTAVFSLFFEKDFIYSIVNGLLMAVSSYLILKRGAVVFIPLLLVVNFYLMTLFFSAERLKVAILVFELAFVFSRYWRWPLLVLSFFFHFQMIVPIASYFIWRAYENNKAALVRIVVFAFVLLGVWLGVAYFSGNFLSYIVEKMTAYNDAGWGGVVALPKPIIFLAVAIFYAPQRLRLLASSLPILVAAYFIGAERITIIAFALMLFVASGVRRGLNFPVLSSCLYFAFGGVLFLLEFIEAGAVGIK
jgi:hypothetical protein